MSIQVQSVVVPGVVSTDDADMLYSKVAKSHKTNKADMLSSKKQKKSKQVDVGSVASVQSSQSSQPSQPSASGVKKLRQARFNSNVPSDFLDLKKVWTYRSSQQRSMKKMRNKLESFESMARDGQMDEAIKLQAAKIKENISRCEYNLEKLRDNAHDVVHRLQLLSDLSKCANVSFDAPTNDILSKVATTLISSFEKPVRNE
jgi:hypothetical protein